MALHAESAPARWELGVGLSGLSVPEYRGSDQQKNYLLPIPYLIYRGERLNVDRRGMRGLLFSSNTMAVNIDGDFGIAAVSKQNGPRAGMSDLDFMLHVGPSLEFTLYERGHSEVLKIKLPAQAVVSMDLSEAGTNGWFFYPRLHYIIRRHQWTLGAALGPIFGTRDYHQYYYGVSTADATTTRPQYSVGAGYSGSRLSMSLSRRMGDIWLGMFARYENIADSVYADSPLVRSNHSLVTGLGVAWVFLRSRHAAVDTPLLESAE